MPDIKGCFKQQKRCLSFDSIGTACLYATKNKLIGPHGAYFCITSRRAVQMMSMLRHLGCSLKQPLMSGLVY